MKFYLLSFFVYLVACGFWIKLYNDHKGHVILIHKYMTVLLVLVCIECAFLYLDYDLYNDSGKRIIGLTTFNVLFSSFRNAFTKLIMLLFSLGYGIVMN